MTLALYGKSRKRQTGLVFTAFMAIMVSVLGALTMVGTAMAHTISGGGTCNPGTGNATVQIVSDNNFGTEYWEVTISTTGTPNLNTTPYSPYLVLGGVTLVNFTQAAGIASTGTVNLYGGSFGTPQDVAADITNVGTTITNDADWPAAYQVGRVIKWENELMKIVSINNAAAGNPMVVTRAFAGTTAVAHFDIVGMEVSVWVRADDTPEDTESWSLPTNCNHIIVKKVVKGAGADTTKIFTVDIDHKGTGGDVNDKAFSQTGTGAYHYYGNEGDNNDYSVKEDAPADPAWQIKGYKILPNDANCPSESQAIDATGTGNNWVAASNAASTASGGLLDSVDDGDTVTVCFLNEYTAPTPPSVSVDKAHSGDGSYNLNESFNFTIALTVTNGPTVAAFQVQDQVPANFTVGTVSPTGSPLNCTKSSNTVTCVLASGTANGIYTATIPVTVNAASACGPVINDVFKDSTTSGNKLDSDTVVIEGCGNISFNKLNGVLDLANSRINWTIQLTNSSVVQGNITIYDPNTSLVSETCLNIVTESPADTYTCLVPGSGSDGGVANLVLSTPLPQGYSPVCDNINVNNTASIAGTQSSDTAQYSDTAEGPVEDCLKVTKTKTSLNGNQAGWTISIENKYDSAVTVFVKDASAHFVSATNGTCGFAVDQDMTVGATCNVNANSTMVITVYKTVPAATCEGTDLPNSVQVWVATFAEGQPDFQADGATYDDTNADPSLCNRIIELCKVWNPNGPLNGASTFLFTGSDTSQEIPATQPLSIPGVTEGDVNGECILVSVSVGLVNFTETVPPGFLTPTWALGHGVGGNTLGSGSGNVVQFHTAECSIAAEEALVGLVRAILSLVVEVETPILPVCTVTFFNTDDGITLNNGAIRVEKYLDINGDGDANDPGEGLIPGWDITGVGPDAQLNGVHDLTDGTLTALGLVTGDVYSITEETRAGYTVTRATVNGVSQGAVTSVGAAVPNGGFTVVQFFNQPKGSILVHKVAVTSHNGSGDVNAPNDDDGWTITVSSANCGVNIVKQTDANGDALFEGLPLCTDYVITESPNNPLSPGFVVVGSASFTGVSPTLNGATAVTFLNRKTTSDPPCVTGCTQTTPTPTPTTPTATPTTPVVTNTPTTPEATPTTPVTNVQGERTPGASPTPIAPSTGGGLMGGTAGGFNILLILAGLIALTSGLGAVALGRKR